MTFRSLVCVFGIIFSNWSVANAAPLFGLHSKHPFCETDISTIELADFRDPLFSPLGFEKRAIRPGLRHVQQEICRCLPGWRRHQPPEVKSTLHIKPNAGEVRVVYSIATPRSRAVNRMAECLGEPTLKVTPMPYKSDIITEDGPVEEVFEYPIIVGLE
jgi:hypothetical protein